MPTLSPIRIVLTGFLALVFAMGIGRFAFTPMLPIMQSEGLLSIREGGELASAHFVGYAMGALAAGWLRAAPKTTLLTSLVTIGLSTIAMGITDSYWAWLASRWIAGVCSALVLVIVSTQFIGLLAEVSRSDLRGWVFAGVGGGTAVVGLATLFMMVFGSPSWHGWLVFGIATMLAAAGISALTGAMKPTSTFIAKSDDRKHSRLPWDILIPYGAMGAGYIIPATYLPVMAQQSVSSPLVFGWGWPIFGAAAALSTVLVGYLPSRFSNRQVWIAGQLIMAAGLLVPALFSNITAVIVAGLCVGGTFMVITMLGLKEANRVGGRSGAQFYIASMTAAFAIGQIVGPLLAGWAYDVTGSFSYPLILGSTMLALSLIPLLRPSSPARRTQTNLAP